MKFDVTVGRRPRALERRTRNRAGGKFPLLATPIITNVLVSWIHTHVKIH